MKWINDRHPELGQKVLVYCGADDVQMACYDGDYIGTDGCRIDCVSHWTEIELPLESKTDDPCGHCRHHLSWSKAQEIADRLNVSASRFYIKQDWTAEDVMCDHEMQYCIPCSKKDE